MFLFPFLQIEEHSRIIIWGNGKMGHDFVEQIKSSNYVHIKYIIDQKNDGEVKSPDIITKNNILFDYVVIAIRDSNIQLQIKIILQSMGVSPLKIILPETIELPYFIDIPYSFNDYFNKEKRDEFLQKFIDDKIGYIELFYRIIYGFKSNRYDYKIYHKALDIIDSEKNVERRIILIRIVLHAGIFTRELYERLYNSVIGINDLECKYMLMTDLVLLPVHNSNILYQGYYEDLNQAYTKLMQDFNLSFKSCKSYLEESVVILFNELSFIEKDDFRIEYIYRIKKLSRKKVVVICTDIRKWYDGISFVMPFDNYATKNESSMYKESHRTYIEDGIDIFYIKGNTIRQRMQNCLDVISNLNVVKIYDMSDDLCPFTYYLLGKIAIDCILWRTNGSCSFYNRIVTTNGKIAKSFSDHYYNERKPVYCEELNISLTSEKPIRIHKKPEYGCNDNTFIIVSVGVRLDEEMSKEFIDKMCLLLSINSQMQWLLVGCVSNVYIREKYSNLVNDKKIIFLPPLDDLTGFFRLCNAYSNPDRTGGGRSIFWAKEQGVHIFLNDIVPSDAEYLVKKENIAHTIGKQMTLIQSEFEKWKNNYFYKENSY